MATIALGEILDDLRAADHILRKYEQRYWLSSDVFYDLYSHGRLDDGENTEDYSEWAGFYKIKQHREELLIEFSRHRIAEISRYDMIRLTFGEPVINIAA